MNENQQFGPFKQNQVIYIGLLVGQVLMGVMLFMLMQGRGTETEVEAPFSYVIPGVVILGITASLLIQQKQSASIPASAPLDEKLAHFRKWNVMKWGVVEGGNLLSLVLTFLFGNILTYTWFGVGVVMFAFLRPTLDKFVTDYQISQKERERLE